MSDTNGKIKIGFYICHCGTNIAGTVDVQKVVDYAGTLPNVAVSRHYKYMCSDPGQDMIQKDIKEHELNRIVVAACSPFLHERTFRNAASKAGLNQFYFQMVNTREQNAWVHLDAEASTEKAIDLVRSAIFRVALHKALEVKKVPIHPDVLVVGGGIAGIHSALTLANAGKKVYLIERELTIGGHMAMFDKTFPTLDCAACILTPKMSAVINHPNITLWTYSEVVNVDGYVGNFKVKVKKKPRYINEEKCTGCTQCIERCPVQHSPYPYPEDAKMDGYAYGLAREVELNADIKEHVDEIIEIHKYERAPLISIMQDVNKDYGFLDASVLRYISRRTEVQLCRVYHVATFYKAFSLTPRGKNHIKVCMGTACHVRGAAKILESLETRLNIKAGQTTEDRMFTLEIVNCLGACAIAPVVTLGEEYHRNMSPTKVRKLIKSCEKEG